MKKGVLLVTVLILCSFNNNKIAQIPQWKTMLGSNVVVCAKVISVDEKTTSVQIEKSLVNGSVGFLLKAGTNIKIPSATKNSYYSFNSVEKGKSYLIYLNYDSKKKLYSFTNSFSVIGIDVNKKIQFYNSKDINNNLATTSDYLKGISQIKETYYIESEQTVNSKLSSKEIYKKYKMSAVSKSFFDETEYFRNNSLNNK